MSLTSIPILFEKVNDIADNRFTQVKIWLCHTGENLNGSYFSKEVLEKMVPSLSNIPIVGYISVDNLNQTDFNGHEERLVFKDGDIDFEYLGRAYGLISSEHNARFETKVCEDGIEREFVVCDGLLWNKFKECTDIFERDLVKSQSMELESTSIKGSFQKDKLFHFTDAKFEAACILGEGITPAMTGSVVEKFSLSSLKQQIGEMFSEMKIYFEKQFSSIDSQEGGKKVDEILELLAKYNLTLENLQEKEIDHEQFSLEELEVKIQEVFTAQEETPVVETLEVPTDFTLTSNQMNDELRRCLSSLETVTEEYWGEKYTYPRYYFRDCKPEENVVVAMDEMNWYLVGFNYTVNGDKIEVDASSVKRYKVDYVPMDIEGIEDTQKFMSVEKYEFALQAKEKFLQSQFEAEKIQLQEQLTQVQGQLEQVEEEKRQYASKLAEKDAKEKEEAQNILFEAFTDKLTEDELSEIKEIKDQFTLEQLEEKLLLVFAKKNIKYTKKEEKQSLRIEIPEDKKVKSNKPYADLFDEK